MAKKPLLSGREVKTLLLLVFFCALAGLLGEAILSLVGKPLAIPTNLHIGGIAGVFFGFMVTLHQTNKPKKNTQIKSKKSKSNKVKKPLFTQQEIETLSLLFALVFIPFLVWLSINYPYEFIRLLGIAVLQGFVFWYQGKKKLVAKIDSSIDEDPIPPSPLPVSPKPTPFNPPSFESVREVRDVEEGNYVAMARELVNKQVGNRLLVSPISVPYQIRLMVNGDERIALRLYEGIASRNMGKDETWIWGKVISDLERDRR